VGRGFLGLFLTFTPPHILGLLSPSPSPDLGPPVDFSLAPPPLHYGIGARVKRGHWHRSSVSGNSRPLWSQGRGSPCL
jgi:hypothetical protein